MLIVGGSVSGKWVYTICGNCRSPVLYNGCTLYVVIVWCSVLGNGCTLYVVIAGCSALGNGCTLYVVIVGCSALGNGCTLYVVIVGGSVLGKWVYNICGNCRGLSLR